MTRRNSTLKQHQDSSEDEDSGTETKQTPSSNGLERNRLAAMKCRQRKKEYLKNLETQVKQGEVKNAALKQQVEELMAQKEQLVSQLPRLREHTVCQCELASIIA